MRRMKEEERESRIDGEKDAPVLYVFFYELLILLSSFSQIDIFNNERLSAAYTCSITSAL